MLLDQGVPVNQVDMFGSTALNYALEGGSGRLSDELQAVSDIPVEEWVSIHAMLVYMLSFLLFS